jgi:two-component system, sensor histidine kinase and response regulator
MKAAEVNGEATSNPSHRPVLIVEDEDELRESLRDLLEDEGYRVEVAADGNEAMLQLVRLRPSLVILDLMMPGMSGNEVYAAMQADPALASIPVIISTSDPSRSPIGVPVLKKPVGIDRLLQYVAKFY